MENEYPKALYRGEDSAVAKSAEHELSLIAQGFNCLPSVEVLKIEDKPKRTRKAEPEAE